MPRRAKAPASGFIPNFFLQYPLCFFQSQWRLPRQKSRVGLCGEGNPFQTPSWQFDSSWILPPRTRFSSHNNTISTHSACGVSENDFVRVCNNASLTLRNWSIDTHLGLPPLRPPPNSRCAAHPHPAGARLGHRLCPSFGPAAAGTILKHPTESLISITKSSTRWIRVLLPFFHRPNFN